MGNCCNCSYCDNCCNRDCCRKASSKELTGYLHVTNDTSQKVVDLKVTVYNSRIVNFDEKSFADKLIFKGDSSVRQDFSVLFERLRSQKKKLDYQYQLFLRFEDETQDIVEFQQLAVLPDVTIVDAYGYRILRNDHILRIVRDRGGRGFKVRLSQTNRQFQDQAAQIDIVRAEEDLQHHKYHSALNNYHLAHKKATRESTQQKASLGKADTYSQLAQEDVKKALLLERENTQEAYEEAQGLLVEAQRKFKAAEEVSNTWQHNQFLKAITLMIEGNRLFDEGGDLERQAFNILKESKDVSLASERLSQALEKYRMATRKYEEGAKYDREKFVDKVRVATGLVEDVGKLISLITVGGRN